MIKLINNFATTLNGAITETATTIMLNKGLPPLASGDYYLLTLFNKVGATELDWEIVKVTSTGAVGGATLTVERGQEGTTAKAFADGTRVEMRLSAGGFIGEINRLESLIYAGL